ncbi:MAG: hypothetical protein Q9181_007750 [Wetmoreana brouardii]
MNTEDAAADRDRGHSRTRRSLTPNPKQVYKTQSPSSFPDHRAEQQKGQLLQLPVLYLQYQQLGPPQLPQPRMRYFILAAASTSTKVEV